MPLELFKKTILTCDQCKKQLEVKGELDLVVTNVELITQQLINLGISNWLILRDEAVVCSPECLRKYLTDDATKEIEKTIATVYKPYNDLVAGKDLPNGPKGDSGPNGVKVP